MSAINTLNKYDTSLRPVKIRGRLYIHYDPTKNQMKGSFLQSLLVAYSKQIYLLKKKKFHSSNSSV